MRSQEHVPATIFVAADHLVRMLVRNFYLRRLPSEDTEDERFAKVWMCGMSTRGMGWQVQRCGIHTVDVRLVDTRGGVASAKRQALRWGRKGQASRKV